MTDRELVEYYADGQIVNRAWKHQNARAKKQTMGWPWIDLDKNEGPLKIFGYGSLMSSKYGIDGQATTPVVAFGVRRVFNYKMPRPWSGKTCLNVEPDPTGIANGVVCDLMRPSLNSFRQRERGYDLLPITCVVIEPGENHGKIVGAWACSASDPKFVDTLPPDELYYRECRRAAAEISPRFLDMYLKTTFLPDGRNAKQFELNAYVDTNGEPYGFPECSP